MGRQKGYNEKADLFSLGVVLFEMGHAPFQTGMERLLTLRKLRERAELPADFAPGSAALRQIVQWLVEADPDKRPSAAQLLASPLLPPPLTRDTDSSYLKEITRALWKPNISSSSTTTTTTAAASEILSVLFDQPMMMAADTTKSKSSLACDEQSLSLSLSLGSVSFDIDVLENYSRLLLPRSIVSPSVGETSKQHHHQHHHVDSSSSSSSRSVCSLRYLAAVKGMARSTFRRHGAVEFRPKLLELRSSYSSSSSSSSSSGSIGSWNPLQGQGQGPVDSHTTSSKQLQYMDCTGKIVLLETNLITQFAKVAAFAQVHRSQRFAIDSVYVPRGIPIIIIILTYHHSSYSYSSSSLLPSPSAASVGGHPLVMEEAAFDTVLMCPDAAEGVAGTGAAMQESLLFADVEAVTAAIEFMCCDGLQAFLPDCVLRLNDPRLLDSIIDLCGWQEQEQEESGRSNTTTSNSTSRSHLHLHRSSIEEGEKESLLRLLSLAADGTLSPAEMSAAVATTTAAWRKDDNKSQQSFLKRLTPFLGVLCSPPKNSNHHHHHHHPLHVLEALEQVLHCFRLNACHIT